MKRILASLLAWGVLLQPAYAVQFGAGTGTGYPSVVDTVNTRANKSGGSCSSATGSNICAEFTNDVQGAVAAIQTELGTLPKGSYADVKTRLNAGVYSGTAGLSSYTVGDLLYASTTTILSKLAGVATGNALLSGGVGTAPSWGKVGLTTHISGILAADNGGTGNAFFAVSGPASSVKTYTLPNVSETIATLGQAQAFSAIQAFDAGFDVRYSATLFDRFTVDSTGALLIKATEKAPPAVTVALAGAGAGNVDNGTHSYKITWATAAGETDAGAVSNVLTVTDSSTNGKVTVPRPTGYSSFVTGWHVYRRIAGDTGDWLKVTTAGAVAIGTSSYTDNIADGSLGAAVPSANTAIDTRTTIANSGLVTLPAGLTVSGGSLGILTADPQRKLHLIANGNNGARIESLDNHIAIELVRPDSAKYATLAFKTTTVRDFKIEATPGGYLEISNDGGVGIVLSSARWVGFGVGTPASLVDLRAGDLTYSGANGQKYVQGRLTELVAVGSGISTKATTIQIPADAVVYAVPVRVKTQPGGTSTMTVTATTSGTAFQKGASISTATGTTDPGNKNTPANYNSVAAQTITFTFDAPTTDALGEIRVDIYYHVPTAPTS